MTYDTVQTAADLAYEVELVTGTFPEANCMCRVIGYELEVTHPSAPNWTLSMGNGTTIQHIKLQGPNGDSLVVDDMSQLMDYFANSSTAVMVAEFFKDELVPSADLIRATGLCIIENYDGFASSSAAPQLHTGPIIDSIPCHGSSSGFEKVAYIPTGITQGI